MANSFVNNSGMVAQALADRTAVNSYQNLMDNINSTVNNLVNTYQNNKIADALKGKQSNVNPQAMGGLDTSSISSIGSSLPFPPVLFNQASNNGVSPQAEPVNNGLNYQAGIEQAIKFGRWDVANKIAQTQQNEEETAFRKEKMAQAQEQQDIENDFRERQLNQQREKLENDVLKNSKQEIFRETEQEKNLRKLELDTKQYKRALQKDFESLPRGKELSKAQVSAIEVQNISKSLKDRIAEVDFDNLTNTSVGRFLDKIGSRFGISTQGAKKLDDLRAVQDQIMSEMRQTLRGQGAVSDSEAAALPKIFMFTSDGRIKNNAKNFIKYLDSVEQRKINSYNDLRQIMLPEIETKELSDYYPLIKTKNENQYAPKEFTLKRNKNTGQVYKVFSDGSYELYNQ